MVARKAVREVVKEDGQDEDAESNGNGAPVAPRPVVRKVASQSPPVEEQDEAVVDTDETIELEDEEES
jgi:hypothetical protein